MMREYWSPAHTMTSTKRFLFALGFFAAVSCLGVSTCSAQIEMLKIVFRRSSPQIAPESAEAKPMTLYIAGDKYTRIEYPVDPANHTQMLIITKEPDNWRINLVDRTAIHVLDPGPTFVSRNPIVWSPKPPGQPDPYEPFRDLEFGNETIFFRQNNPRDLGDRNIDGKNTKVSAIKAGGVEVTLFRDPEADKPVRIDLTKDGKPVMSFHYLQYDTKVPFDPTLFQLPEGIKVSEAK